jgi:hypothetical protein
MVDGASSVEALPADADSWADAGLSVAVVLRADAQLVDFAVAPFAVEAPSAVAEGAVSTVVVDTVVAADTGKFVRGLI